LYARIRHPIYLSLLMMNLGMGLGFGLVITVVLALIFSCIWGLTALTEEKFLLQKFPKHYRKYMHAVKWRIIPYIF
jgi:protein-S-isoprenylcysteine O-methyltransferase Ste14